MALKTNLLRQCKNGKNIFCIDKPLIYYYFTIPTSIISRISFFLLKTIGRYHFLLRNKKKTLRLPVPSQNVTLCSQFASPAHVFAYACKTLFSLSAKGRPTNEQTKRSKSVQLSLRIYDQTPADHVGTWILSQAAATVVALFEQIAPDCKNLDKRRSLS